MIKDDDMNIDFDKLRKRLVSREFLEGALTRTQGDFVNCVNASNATPEELLAIARRRNVNLDKYRIN